MSAYDFLLVDKSTPNFFRLIRDENVVQVFFRFLVRRSILEILAIKVKSCQKSIVQNFGLFSLQTFWGQPF